MKRSPARYLLLLVLLAVLIVLQVRLWFGSGSLRDGMLLQQQADQLEAKNTELRERNDLKAADVHDLKNGTGEVEEIARKDLGMIRQGEVFYQILGDKLPEESQQQGKSAAPAKPVEHGP
jgi:cell division protein FtsB